MDAWSRVTEFECQESLRIIAAMSDSQMCDLWLALSELDRTRLHRVYHERDLKRRMRDKRCLYGS